MLLVNRVTDTKQSRLQRMSDARLVSAAVKGNREAYRELVERYQQKAIATAIQIVKSKEDAEDVVQDAFVKAYMNLKSFKGDAKFSTWFYRIVYTTAIDMKRRLNRRGGGTLEFNEETVSDTESPLMANRYQNPATQVANHEELTMVRKALNTLSEEHRTVITLRELEGFSYTEIAQITGVTKGTVMSRLFYARKKLQEKIQAMNDVRPGDVPNLEKKSTISLTQGVEKQ